MQIYGPHSVHGAQPIGAPHVQQASRPVEPAPPGQIQDEVQISDLAQALARVHDLPDIRADRVAQIRAEIAAGTYATDGKLSVALDRLLDEIG